MHLAVSVIEFIQSVRLHAGGQKQRSQLDYTYRCRSW